MPRAGRRRFLALWAPSQTSEVAKRFYGTFARAAAVL